MSIKIHLDSLTLPERTKIVKELKFNKKDNKYNKLVVNPTIYPYDTDDNDNIFLPFAWALKNIGNCIRPRREVHSDLETTFSKEITFREEQKQVIKEAIQLLNKNGTCILSVYTGFGKTICSIKLACKIKLKTLIVVSRLVLVNQWINSINKCCENPKIQFLTARTPLNLSNDFFIMNALNIPKKPHGFFDDIGTIITDEIHLIATEKLIQSFNYLRPRYMIGLSATPTRPDGMDALLDVYFGKDKIYRKLFRKHFVYKVQTNFEPTFQLGATGKVDWNSILESQTEDITRNELIIKLVQYFKDRFFLILSKRVKQVSYLVNRLKSVGESVTSLVGDEKEYNESSRILVATVQKAGVGFDHPKLDALILASDVEEYFIQYLGRVMRREDVEPYIFDLVDDNKILKSHFYVRRRVYTNHGGEIRDFSRVFPNFK